MKKLKNYSSFILLALAFIGVIILLVYVIIGNNKQNKAETSKKELTDALKFKEEYEGLNGKKNSADKEYPEISISENNIIKYSSYEEIFDVIDNKKSAVIYLGFETCPWCRNAIPKLLQAASVTTLDSILYLNIKDDRNELELNDGKIVTKKEGNPNYIKLVEKLSAKLSTYKGLNDESIKRIYAPSVVFIKNGEILNIHVSTVDSQTDPYTPLDSNQSKELYDIYKENILNVIGTSCDEAC